MIKKINPFTTIYILIMSAAVAFIFNYFNPEGITFLYINKGEAAVKENIQFVKPISINAEDAYLLFTKKVRSIDIRAAIDYKNGHIPGAINIPFEYLKDVRSTLKPYPQDSPFVLYGSADERRSLDFSSEEIFGAGYKKLYTFPDGFESWTKNKYPVEK